MKHIKFSIHLFYIFSIFLLVSCNQNRVDKTLKVGVISPFTGDLSLYANNAKNGMILAQQEINESKNPENKYKLELIYEDTKLSPKEAVNAVNKLITIDKVRLIIGDITSAATLAVAPIVEKNKVILLSNGASAPKVRFAGDYVFRLWNSDDYESKKMAEYLINNNIKSCGILYSVDEYSLGLFDSFKKTFKYLGGEISLELNYKPNTTNFRNIIVKIPEDIRNLYILGYPKELGVFIKQLREKRKDISIYGSSTLDTKEFVDIANRNNTESIVLTSPFLELDSIYGNNKNFYKDYIKKFGKDPDIFAAISYDAVKISYEAFKNSNWDVNQLKNEMYKIKNYIGITGSITFDEYGDVSKPIVFKKIKGGEFVQLFKTQ